MNIFYQIKPNILINSFNFKSSKITLKIKGIGESNILGNEEIKKFQNINYLKEIKINGKIQDEIKYNYYFNKKDNYVELIWSDDLDNCDNMFYKCSSITEINLSNFNTSNVTSMYCMFDGCSSMTSIDLSNFDTSHATHMAGMFYNCQSLTSLNLSFFNTSLVQHMHNMFYNCISLTSLLDLDGMFLNCYNLEYINLKNFEERKIVNDPDYYHNMLNNIPINIVICINEGSTKEKIFPQIKNKTCYINDCTDNWKSNKLQIINDTLECIEHCENSLLYHYEYNDKCYEKCEQGFLYDNNNIQTNKCKCQLDECLICPNVALNKGLCT